MKTSCEGQQCHDCMKVDLFVDGKYSCPHTHKDEETGFFYGPDGDEPACWEFKQK